MAELFKIGTVDELTIANERNRAMSLLREILPEASIFEVGSTAVKGLIGKQDLDFLVRVPKSEFETTRRILDQSLERNLNQMSTEIYQGYLVDSQHDVAVQLTIEAGPHDTFLEFMELLKADKKLREEYNELKREFDGQPMDVYRTAKRDFIERSLAAGN